jgi:hypothetical protein
MSDPPLFKWRHFEADTRIVKIFELVYLRRVAVQTSLPLPLVFCPAIINTDTSV